MPNDDPIIIKPQKKASRLATELAAPAVIPDASPSRIVHDAANWHKWWSMRWIIITGFYSGAIAAYALLPADWLPAIPDPVKRWLALGSVFTAGFAAIARIINQKNLQ